MKRISILGSTGSIGTSTLQIARHLGRDSVQVTALAAHSNIDLLEKQAREFSPKLIAVFDVEKSRELQKRLPHIEVVNGMTGLEAVASYSETNFVVSAMTGTSGLIPTIAAIKSGKNVGLANKEALISGGALVIDLAKRFKVNLIPIDSEHSAIFQCLNGAKPSTVRRIILTASGGPFRTYTSEQLDLITPEKALLHPTWKMGPKITIDCSTLMNKGLEVIEAHWLFGVSVNQVEVVIHPQSIIHSMVEYIDGSMLAQMSEPNMIVPIQYAITYPERVQGILKPFDFLKNGTLHFYQPDTDKFRCLFLAYEAIRQGGSLACYMNAANEVLVDRFLNRQISWKEIGIKLEQLMSLHHVEKVTSIEDVLETDARARSEASCM